MSRFLLLCLTCFITLPAAAPARDLHGTTEPGEGGEVVVTEGLVIREVRSTDAGAKPLIAVGSADGVHQLYDPNLNAFAGVWSGRFGRINEAGDFTIDRSQLKSFSLDRSPWSFGEKPRVFLDHELKGYEIRDGKALFKYRLAEPDGNLTWDVEETLEYVSEQLQRLHFSIKASADSELYLSYWLTQTDFRSVTSNGQPIQRNKLKNLFANQKEFTISFLRQKQTPTVPNGYTIEAIEIPTPTLPNRFEPTDITFAKDGTAYVSTRTGGIWKRNSGDGKWSLFADGLHEANGIRIAPDGDGIYVMQKPELTLLKDTDHDGVADLYTTVEDRYRFTGHYHEFAYGPRINGKGEMFFSTGLASSGYHFATPKTQNQMTSALGYRGWVMRRNPDGTLTPFAAGLRSPAGIGMNAKDELFVTDNQGDWVASSYLGHVEQGDFLGHPAALWDRPEYGFTPEVLDYTTSAAIPEKVPYLDKANFSKFRKRPAVWLSHGDLTNSPGHPSFAPETGFGPFGGQAFIADIAHRNVIRVALEKVAGEYQGAVFPFIRPLQSASYSTAFDNDGNLWVGSVGRGWTAGDPAIEIIRYDESRTPFEMQRIALTKDGFDIVFTEALGPDTPTVETVSIKEFQYQYWDEYGSEPINAAAVSIEHLSLSEDRKTLSLLLPRKADFIYQIQLSEIKSASGLPLENDYGIYTLNNLLP